ncbi:glycosyltransferase [Ferrovibrio terrae]|uniref:glycosyltransferase n=1 Tax=Ferrovibrio terrae TaxID=2594003 RepID=UPI003137DCC0
MRELILPQLAPREPTVSVVTYVRNACGTISKALESIVNQDYPYLQLVVVDGASTDGTRDIIARYADRIAVFVSEPDSGPLEAATKGLALVTGDIVLFVMADDWLVEGAIRRLADEFLRHPTCGIVSFGARIETQAEAGAQIVLERYGYENRLDLRNLLGIPLTAARAWRRELMDIIGGLDPHYPAAHDREWFMRAWIAGVSTAEINDILYIYTQHAGSTTLGGDPRRIIAYLEEHVGLAGMWLRYVSGEEAAMVRDWRRLQLKEGLLIALRLKSIGLIGHWLVLALARDPAAASDALKYCLRRLLGMAT